MSTPFGRLEDIAVAMFEGVRPPERLTVAQAAVRHRKLNNRGSYVGPWKHDRTPYLIEPMEVLTDLNYTGMIFVGPAQCGKTELYLNWQTYTVLVDPADLMLVQTSQLAAGDFSKRRVDRLHRDTKAVGARLMPGHNNNNTFDKRYIGGSMVTLSWPTVNELSGKPIPRLFLTDYDRMDQDVEKNGPPYDLAAARMTTFGRHGMCVAESSPSFPVTDPRWSPSTRHEAPPTDGILKLYNRGDRRRWYWVCQNEKCRMPFEPTFSLISWPDTQDPLEAGEAAWLSCPHCQSRYYHENTDHAPGKRWMNQNGLWLRDGEVMTPDGEVVGTAPRSKIASFMLNGAAAGFSDWTKLVSRQIIAEQEFDRTGIEDGLKVTANTDRGEAYMPKSMQSDRVPEQIKDRAVDWGHKVVPTEVRFLVAAVDVQKNRFEVQVHGIAQGGDIYIVDRFQIRHSRRPDESREGQVHYVRPFTYREDWRVLLDEVIMRSYPLADGSERRMSVKITVCDSGGQDRGTANSYDFYRWLKDGPAETDLDKDDWPKWSPGLASRFQLYKGNSTQGGPRVRVNYPDSQRKDRTAGARGEIPVLMVNTDAVKNMLDSMLDRDTPRGGQLHFPAFLGLDFYKELCVEVKSTKGQWENPKSFRNESWDLLVECISVCLEPRHVNIERLNWADPPGWADVWDANDLVFDPSVADSAIAISSNKDYDLRNLGTTLA